MLYTIRLQQMEFRAYHGCYDLEQVVGNRFVVELAITTPLGAVADEDAVEKAVNYLTVYETVREVMKIKCRTIERVAQNIIREVRALYPEIVEDLLHCSLCCFPLFLCTLVLVLRVFGIPL